MEGGEKVVIEGHVSIARIGDTDERAVFVWNPRVDKASNLADFIEAAFGAEENIGFYGSMRITIERT
jgi:D-hexose-6-phosphate mutarotase